MTLFLSGEGIYVVLARGWLRTVCLQGPGCSQADCLSLAPLPAFPGYSVSAAPCPPLWG